MVVLAQSLNQGITLKKILYYYSLIILIISGCSSSNYTKTVPEIDLSKFLKKWYVIAGRLTFIETGSHNAVEEYSYNIDKKRIDINFNFNKDSFDGPHKSYPQKAWVYNETTKAHWKVSPFWPLKFDFLIIAVAKDYSWTAIGVPNQKYLWIMSDSWRMDDTKLSEIKNTILLAGYNVENIIRVPQNWSN